MSKANALIDRHVGEDTLGFLECPQLYKHQRSAVDRMRDSSILVAGVGSGKTLTCLTYFYEKVCGGQLWDADGNKSFKKATNPMDLYIVTPAKKVETGDWEQEALPFCFPLSGINMYVISWNKITDYIYTKDAYFIMDEDRLIGKGAWVKAFLKIAKNNRWLVATATPSDSFMDLVPIWIAAGYYRNRTEFINRHVVYSNYTKWPKVERYLEQGRLIRLKNEVIVNMHFERETEPHHKYIECNFSMPLQDVILKRRWNPYENKPIKDAGEMCRLLRRMSNSDPDRILKVKEILNHHPKALIFYNFNFELDLLIEMAEAIGVPYAQLNGHKHEQIPKTKTWVYLIQYTAGSEAFNCIETDTTIFYSANYSYRQTVQAAGRIDRLNTPFFDLWYYHLTSKSQIDMAIQKCLKKKQNFNESTFMRSE